jgi:hypothetical protein
MTARGVAFRLVSWPLRCINSSCMKKKKDPTDDPKLPPPDPEPDQPEPHPPIPDPDPPDLGPDVGPPLAPGTAGY